MFLLTNLVLRVALDEDQHHFQEFRLKTMTIGVALVVSTISFIALLQLLPKSNFDMVPNYALIAMITSLLLLYVIKEHEFTIPFTLNLLKSLWSRCQSQNTINAVVPFQLQIPPMQELNPRALRCNMLSQDSRIIDLEDDGGVAYITNEAT